MRLFSRHGYSATSIRSIAEEAGVAQGLLYSHFQGKEDLLKALFRRSMDDVQESFAAAAAVGSDARPPLARLVDSALLILKRNLEFWRLSYGVRMQEEVVAVLGPDLQAWTRNILDTLEAHFRAAAASAKASAPAAKTAAPAAGTGVQAAEAAVNAALFFAAFDGMCQHFVLDPEHYPLEAVSRSLLARFTPSTRPASHPSGTRPSEPKGASHDRRRRR